ncbi:hypothetical protein BN946_scf185035.g10 [Trametes cinnabarina]|uniref:Protein kinase domain-containing protein n=1 Tax=Pycnoporus cinnabarinus TaxID=5643 RepID=A0A060S390_PYCCI|nr:hypothetical protein BN946_scf185035.g10 [Trametes cinnabarina]
MASNSLNATPPRLRPLSGLFSATQRPGVATVRRELRETMIHKLLGLPYDEWMAAFLPANDVGINENASYEGLFDKVLLDQGEDKMYGPFVDAVNKADILDRFELAQTYSKYDKTDNAQKKADGGMYPKGSLAVKDKRTDWAEVEVFIECKVNDSCDPYDENARDGIPFADSKRDALGQIATYASSVFEYQQLTHHFSVVILGSWARLARWDRSGVIFSSKFNYKQEPAKLARFFWRVAHASAEVRGHDHTATRVLPGSVDYELLQAWKAKGKTLSDSDYVAKRFIKSLSGDRPWWRLTVSDKTHGARDFLVGRPTFAAAGVVGRGTRGYIALSISDPSMPFVYLKDCWRMVHERSKLEGDILSYLNEKRVANIPTALYHGDVEGQVTVSQTFWKAPGGNTAHDTNENVDDGGRKTETEKKNTCRLKTHQHYRLVVREVGVPLQEFPTGKVLIQVIADAIKAHKDAYKKAEVMHRDISVGNILMIPHVGKKGRTKYRGLLADWELSKQRSDEDMDPRHPDRTGTWQFMSVHALSEPEAQIQIADELESFLHVMIYCAIRYLPSTCRNVGEFMYSFFDDGERVGEAEYTCGLLKRSVIDKAKLQASTGQAIAFLRRPRLPPSEERSAGTDQGPTTMHPINGIIVQLLKWFRARYMLLDSAENAVISGSGHEKAGSSSVSDSSPDSDSSDSNPDSDCDPSSDSEQSHEDNSIVDESQSQKELKLFAKKIQSHRHMRTLLINALKRKEAAWPTSGDRQRDQLDPAFNPHKQAKTREKRTAPEPEPQDQRSSKRLRSVTFEA